MDQRGHPLSMKCVFLILPINSMLLLSATGVRPASGGLRGVEWPPQSHWWSWTNPFDAFTLLNNAYFFWLLIIRSEIKSVPGTYAKALLEPFHSGKREPRKSIQWSLGHRVTSLAPPCGAMAEVWCSHRAAILFQLAATAPWLTGDTDGVRRLSANVCPTVCSPLLSEPSSE